jgi:two-component system NtrC family sensor kinase
MTMQRPVLVVDDSLTVRMDLVEAFEAAGIRAIPAANLAAAREVMRTEDVGLVVLDVRLPDGDGVELLREIRSDAGSHVRVMMLSSDAAVRDRMRGLDAGADEYVGKPYDRDYVISRAQELLRFDDATRGAAICVLVVDDSATFRHALADALAAEGYKVLTAASGEEGLRTAAAKRPAAIIVDGMMPGIDGATFIRRIRIDSALRGMPCMLLTASDDDDDELRALDAGADSFVRKQLDARVILARFGAMLRSGRDRQPGHGAASLMGPKRVLAVDDSRTYLDLVTTALRGEGYDVAIATSGEEALEMLPVQEFDCILLDRMMPGIGGEETCRRIKTSSEFRDIPLIMLTASDDRDAMLAGLGAGADDYIPKSSDFDVLRARMRAQLRRRQFEDENRSYREQLLRLKLDATEARAARELAETRAALVGQLERTNEELEAFSYSVSHDLRAPLRAIDGFSQILLEDYGEGLDDRARGYLGRVRAAATRMGELIDDLLMLSRVSRIELHRDQYDLSDSAARTAEVIADAAPERQVEFVIAPGLIVNADRGLMKVLLENVIGNAWKFTSKRATARIELRAYAHDGTTAYVISDDGVGFDPAAAGKLFMPFQRLHTQQEFPGTGIGLATVRRIVERHGGKVWAESTLGQGARVHWTLG